MAWTLEDAPNDEAMMTDVPISDRPGVSRAVEPPRAHRARRPDRSARDTHPAGGHPPGVVLNAVWHRSDARDWGCAQARQLAHAVMAAGVRFNSDTTVEPSVGRARAAADTELKDDAA